MIQQSPPLLITSDALAFISLLVGLLSLAMGAISIWLSLHFKGEADRVNERTSALLMEVKTDAKTVANTMAGELKDWGDTGRQVVMSRSFTGRSEALTTGDFNDPATAPPIASSVDGAADASR